MFYSHEVLTSRKYGVATVWLVATLGAKSGSKKVNRKAILEVDVPKACRTIINPVAPMALRLQGNLLYGVSRVYVQQCGYVLSDAQNVHDSMYLMIQAMKTISLDPEAGKARPEQLVLQDDPSYLPEFALPPLELIANLDLAAQFKPLLGAGDSQLLSSTASQHKTPERLSPVGGLIVPSSSTINMGEFKIQGDNGPGSRAASNTLSFRGRDEVMPDADFTFDINGDLVEFGFDKTHVLSGTPNRTEILISSHAEAQAGVALERDTGTQVNAPPLNYEMELDLPMLGGNELRASEALPPSQIQQTSLIAAESDQTSMAPAARQRRVARTIPLDAAVELRNRDLADWNENYLENMKKTVKNKQQNKSAQLAKTNADFMVWGAGLGRIGARFLGTVGPTPFDRFIGNPFFEMITGIGSKPQKSSKRDRDSGIDEATQEEARRVRQRVDELEPQFGRGQDSDQVMLGDDDVELPREPGSALDDHQISSIMPWNISTSIQGSSVVNRSGRPGIPSSVSGPLGRSRMVSASPLHGRGQLGRLGVIERFQEFDENAGNLGDEGFELAGSGISPGALKFTNALQDEPIQESLPGESDNFLVYIANAINNKRTQMGFNAGLRSAIDQAEAADDNQKISLEDLIPPRMSTKIVAAQAFLMVLTLGTRAFLDVHQDKEKDDIEMCLSNKGKEALNQMAVNVQEDVFEQNEDDATVERNNLVEEFDAGYDSNDEQDNDGADEVDSLYAD